ncbi:Uncharacterized conserved protein [Phaffia rhodozyma]|uniref:Uncharacterized conserved protein n=1 Tax=Phaffia rhodozyma TaxID=264483 RepID=A0A0F7SPD3_PHARH|nr:Uncharacterized conserved protein [Phaffia rhodozyma]
MLLSNIKPRNDYGTWTPKTTSRAKIAGMYKRIISTFYPTVIIFLVYYFISTLFPTVVPQLRFDPSNEISPKEFQRDTVAPDHTHSSPTIPLPISRKTSAIAAKPLKKDHQNGLWQDMEYADDTSSPGGVVGYTVFNNLYTANGTLFAVTSDASSLPPVSTFLSQDLNGPADEKLFRIITPGMARELFGKRVIRLDGDSVFFADAAPDSFLAHYYHFVVECFSGAWKALISVSDKPLEEMNTPRRMIIARDPKWRDGPNLNAWFMNVILPDAIIEDEPMWLDRAKSGQAYVFERVVIVDRWAAHRHSSAVNKWNKMNAEVYDLKGPLNWFEPLRQSLKHSLQISEDQVSEKPVITYINRQKSKRRALKPASHDELLISLMEIQSEGLADVYDAQMETMSKQEQFALATRTNIMIGVHGNGLSHLMWMPRGSDVIEIFTPQGFTRDYEIITPALGHNHHVIWNDTIEAEESWRAKGHTSFPDDFQGTMIPVSGPLIKNLIKRIIADKYSRKSSLAEHDKLSMEIH